MRFSENVKKFIPLDTLIVPQHRYFSHHGKMFFPVQNNFPIERWEKLGFITFKSKFE